MIIALASVLLLLSPADAWTQQRQIYDAAGRNAGRAITDTQGTTTVYDPAGNVTARSSITGNTTTVYDAAGHRIETVTRPLSPISPVKEYSPDKPDVNRRAEKRIL